MTCIPEMWHHPTIPVQIWMEGRELQLRLTNDQSWQWRNWHYFTVHLNAMHSCSCSKSTHSAWEFMLGGPGLSWVFLHIVACFRWHEQWARGFGLDSFAGVQQGRRMLAGTDLSVCEIIISSLSCCVHGHLELNGAVLFCCRVSLHNIL